MMDATTTTPRHTQGQTPSLSATAPTDDVTLLQLLPRTEVDGDDDSSADGCGGEDKNIVVLPEAENLSAKRRALVSLPSGKLLACMGSVLVKYCSALEGQGPQLLTNVVHIDYTAIFGGKGEIKDEGELAVLFG